MGWNYNREFRVSTTSTKAEEWVPAYSKALYQYIFNRQRVKTQCVRQTDIQRAKVDGV